MQLLFQTLLHNSGQLFSVKLMRLVITDCRQGLIRIRNHGGTLIRAHRRYGFYHIRNPVGIGNDDLLRLVTAQMRKLRQHFFCRPQIQRRLIIRIVKPFSCHNNTPVHLVLRV